MFPSFLFYAIIQIELSFSPLKTIRWSIAFIFIQFKFANEFLVILGLLNRHLSLFKSVCSFHFVFLFSHHQHRSEKWKNYFDESNLGRFYLFLYIFDSSFAYTTQFDRSKFSVTISLKKGFRTWFSLFNFQKLLLYKISRIVPLHEYSNWACLGIKIIFYLNWTFKASNLNKKSYIYQKIFNAHCDRNI